MKKKNGGVVTEYPLWHGTGSDNIDSICRQNFDSRLYSTHAHGKGSYFARDASYSLNYSSQDAINGRGREYRMFYASVLVGSYTKGSISFYILLVYIMRKL